MSDRRHHEDPRHSRRTPSSVPGTGLGEARKAHGSFPVAGESRRLPIGHQATRNALRFELRCVSCGYGVVVRVAPDGCPMCRGSVWELPDSPSGAARR